MGTLADKRDALIKKGNDLIEARKDADLTDEDRTALSNYKAQIEDLNAQIKQANEDEKIVAAFSKVQPDDSGPADEEPAEDGPKARTLGEHFAKSVGHDQILALKGRMGSGVAAPEFKAATDTHTVAEAATAGVRPWITEYDPNVVQAYRPQVQIKNLFGQGTLSGDSIAYLVEGAREGDPALTAEAAAFSQVHYVSPTPVTETLKKITALHKVTDESLSDLGFLISEIDGRVRYDVDWKTEVQLLAGTAASGLTGLLNRSGIQSEEVDDDENSVDAAQDAIFRALTKVTTATGMKADAIVMNPADYQALRLAKDLNGQYYGGGFFSGQYGQGGVVEDLPLWGTRTVVSPAITAGTVLVGAFAASATVYSKGGIAVSMTNSNEDDFEKGLVSLRAEVRLALAVRRPSGFVKVTL